MDPRALEQKDRLKSFKRGDTMRGSQEGDPAGSREGAGSRGEEGAEQEGRVWPSAGVKDNKEGLKRL